jgi:hypothetical protein
MIDYNKVETLFRHKHAKRIHSRQSDVLQKLASIHRTGIPCGEMESMCRVLDAVWELWQEQVGWELIPSVRDVLVLFRIETQEERIQGRVVHCLSRFVDIPELEHIATQSLKRYLPWEDHELELLDRLVGVLRPGCSVGILQCLERLLESPGTLKALRQRAFAYLQVEHVPVSLPNLDDNLSDDFYCCPSDIKKEQLRKDDNYIPILLSFLAQVEEPLRGLTWTVLDRMYTSSPQIVSLLYVLHFDLIASLFGGDMDQDLLVLVAQAVRSADKETHERIFELCKDRSCVLSLSIMEQQVQEEPMRHMYLSRGMIPQLLQWLPQESDRSALIRSNHIFRILQQLVVIDVKPFLYARGLEWVLESIHQVLEWIQENESKNPRIADYDCYEYATLCTTLLHSLLTLLHSLQTTPTTRKRSLPFFQAGIHILSVFREYQTLLTTLLLFSTMCGNPKSNKIEFQALGGVERILSHLQGVKGEEGGYRVPYLTSQERVTYLWALAECIWGCIVGHPSSEEEFITKGGIDLLLVLLHSLVDSDAADCKTHLLGCLLDLLENPKTIRHVIQWQHNKDTISKLLLRIWEREGPETGDTIRSLSSTNRSKIYSLFSKLGFPREGLSTAELILMESVSKYLDFKIKSMWEENILWFQTSGVRPVSPDLHTLQQITKTHQEKCHYVLQRQEELRHHQVFSINQMQQQKEQESKFFHDYLQEFGPRPEPVRKPRIHTWKQSLLT